MPRVGSAGIEFERRFWVCWRGASAQSCLNVITYDSGGVRCVGVLIEGGVGLSGLPKRGHAAAAPLCESAGCRCRLLSSVHGLRRHRARSCPTLRRTDFVGIQCAFRQINSAFRRGGRVTRAGCCGTPAAHPTQRACVRRVTRGPVILTSWSGGSCCRIVVCLPVLAVRGGVVAMQRGVRCCLEVCRRRPLPSPTGRGCSSIMGGNRGRKRRAELLA